MSSPRVFRFSFHYLCILLSGRKFTLSAQLIKPHLVNVPQSPFSSSSETQGQIVGTRKRLNGGKIYGTKKNKKRREEPLGTMSYETSSKRSPPFWLLIGARKLVFFWHQSEARTAATVWNWSRKTLSPGALLAVFYFSSCHIFFRPFRLFLVPTICPWVSEDAFSCEKERKNNFLHTENSTRQIINA